MRHFNIVADRSILAASSRCVSQATASIIAELEQQNFRAAQDTADRFAKLPRDEQIQCFQKYLIQLPGILRCVGQNEALANRRQAFIQLVYFCFQFNRRLDILMKAGVSDEAITAISLDVAQQIKRAALFSLSRRPCVSTERSTCQMQAMQIKAEDIQHELAIALSRIHAGRIADRISNLLQATHRFKGGYKERFVLGEGEDAAAILTALQAMDYFLPKHKTQLARRAKLRACAMGLVEPIALREPVGRQLPGLRAGTAPAAQVGFGTLAVA